MIPPPESLLIPLNLPHKLLMGPGPSNCSPRVLAASALPLLGHLHPEFLEVMDEIKLGIKYLFQTRNEITLAVSATGHGAMETACCNMVEPGDSVLVAINGLWGERFAEMTERHSGDLHKVIKPPGNAFTTQEIEEALTQYKPKVMFITHGESSGTTCQPLADLGKLCHAHDCLLIVDSVAAAGGVPLLMDEWEIDVLYTGSQKVLSAPPGASPISFSDRAWQKILSRKTKVQSFYLDVIQLANYWGCHDQPRRYHHTGPMSSMYTLREGLAMLVEESLEACWERHKQCVQILYEGMDRLKLEYLVSDPALRLPTVTGIMVPSGVNWKHVTEFAMKKYRIEISGGLGSTAGKIWRVGIMGYNATPENVRRVLRALEEGIEYSRELGDSKL